VTRRPFAYQSCSTGRSFPSSIEGALDFMRLPSLAAAFSGAPAGPQFSEGSATANGSDGSLWVKARMLPLSFVVPPFIY
jgi:hypothetical protein